jgi:hypothetical protein
MAKPQLSRKNEKCRGMIYYYASLAHDYFTLLKMDLIWKDCGAEYRPKRKKLKGYQKSRK